MTRVEVAMSVGVVHLEGSRPFERVGKEMGASTVAAWLWPSSAPTKRASWAIKQREQATWTNNRSRTRRKSNSHRSRRQQARSEEVQGMTESKE